MSHNQLAYDWIYTFNRLPRDVEWEQFSRDLAGIVTARDVADLLFEQGAAFVAAQEESAPSTGHRHWHVFIQYHERVKPGRLWSLLGRQYGACKPNYQRRRGTPEEAFAYCTKEQTREDGPLICGELQREREGQGRRRDLDAIGEEVLQGRELRDIAGEHPASWIRYNRGAPEPRYLLL